MPPTYDTTDEFNRDWSRLPKDQRDLFKQARDQFRDDLRAGVRFRKGLRVKRVEGRVVDAAGKRVSIWELTWDGNGRATWQYGDAIKPGEPHVIWRRVGTHDIFGDP